jgi:hypothetical protein
MKKMLCGLTNRIGYLKPVGSTLLKRKQGGEDPWKPLDNYKRRFQKDDIYHQ